MSSHVLYERERRAHRRLEAEAAQDRLRAVVARAHGDALLVERAADVLGALTPSSTNEMHARLLRRGADDAAGPGRVEQLLVA